MGGEIPPHIWVNTSMDTEVEIKQTDKLDISKPKKYSVILYNDDSTPMEFVIEMLQTYFSKSQEQATEIMLHIHQKGIGICGLYTYEIAESKATQVLDKARKNQHPLQIKLEKE